MTIVNPAVFTNSRFFLVDKERLFCYYLLAKKEHAFGGSDMKTYRITSRFRFTIFLIILTCLFTAVFTSWAHINVVNGQNTARQNVIAVTVSEGDTLWDIAAENSNSKTDVRKEIYKIRKYNHLKNSEIKAGQTILIPLDEE